MSTPLAYLGEQLAAWRRAGTYQPLRVLESESAPESRFDGQHVINLASNNYLGLTTHPKLREAALEATRKYGVGSGAVRTISGTMSIHMQLEDHIISDALNHASIIDGCRLSRAKIHVFPHKDVTAADKILADLTAAPGHK